MQYLGNIETGEVCASSNWTKVFPYVIREQALLTGLAVEITGKQKGEVKCILRKKNKVNGKYDFISFNSRQWREAQKYKNDGWEIRKDFDYKTTYDEYSILGQIKNK